MDDNYDDDYFASHPIIKNLHRQRDNGGKDYVIFEDGELLLPNIVMKEYGFAPGQRVDNLMARSAARSTMHLVVAMDDLLKIMPVLQGHNLGPDVTLSPGCVRVSHTRFPASDQKSLPGLVEDAGIAPAAAMHPRGSGRPLTRSFWQRAALWLRRILSKSRRNRAHKRDWN